MATFSLDDIAIGQTIRFKTVSPHDNNYWYAKVIGITTYAVAKTISDVDAYYLDVKKYYPTISAKEKLTYLILESQESDSVTATRVHAKEWIDINTLEQVSENTFTLFKVYDLSEETAQDLLTSLKAMGFTCEIVKEE